LLTPLVYVIDDDLPIRKAIGRLLESEDYSVVMFTGAREFLARAHTGPLCVILDLNMPGLNGLELQEALAGRGRAEQVIFITGGASVPTCVQAMKAGAVDYLPKSSETKISCAPSGGLSSGHPSSGSSVRSARRCVIDLQRSHHASLTCSKA